MTRNRRRDSLLRFSLFLTGLAVLAWWLQAVAGQPKVLHTPQIVEIVIDNDKDKIPTVREVDLRPNTPTELGFELKNNAGEILGDVTLKIVQVVNGADVVIAQAKVPKLALAEDKTNWLLVHLFEKIKGAPEKLVLAGSSPFRVQLHIEAKNLPLTKRELKLVLREPRDYVAPTVKVRYSATESVLQADVEPKDERTFFGSHLLPVQLVLGPDLRPTKKGNFKQTLTGAEQKLTLIAEDIAFARVPAEGDVYLDVDGYERAFTYQVKENASGSIEPRPAGEFRVRINVPRFARPNAKFEVPLEIDGPISGDYQVHLALDRTGDTKVIPATDFRALDGLRQQKLTLSVDAMGKLSCQAEVRDWRSAFDTSAILGRPAWFRVSVVKKGERMKLTPVPESRLLVARTESDERVKEIKSVFAVVIFDESAPEGLKLELSKDKEWAAGVPLEVRASIRERLPTQAPIAKVVFFKGRAPKDDKEMIKEEDIIAIDEPIDPKQKEWKFILPAQTKAEPLVLSVQFTTVTGVKATITETLTITPAVVAKKVFTVKGKVVRGMLGQPGLEVTLLDVKRNEKAKVKADDKGVFEFDNVEPGAYIVTSRVSAQDYYGETPIDVPSKDKKELRVTVSLQRK